MGDEVPEHGANGSKEQFGYENGGHTFGDKLSGDERRAVIEYLKRL